MSIFLSKPAFYVYAAIAAVLLLWAVHTHIYNNGYEAAELHYKAEIAATAAALAEADANEQSRQSIANNAAKKREAEALAEIAAREQEITELRKELRLEAKQDPDAGRTALGSGSVQRINKIR